MRLKDAGVVLLAVVLAVAPSNGQKPGKEEESTSVFSSFLKTLSSSKESPTCPGRCFNALAALACREVVDRPGLCNEPGYRCCKNLSAKDDSSSDDSKRDDVSTSATKATTTLTKGNLEEEIETVGETVDSDSGVEGTDPSTKEKVEEGQAEDQELQNPSKKTDDENLIQYSAPTSVKVCPGVCVAERISNFCEAAIDVGGLCKTQLRCCVPANLFDGVENVPKEFIILNPSKDEDTEEGSRAGTSTSRPKETTEMTTDLSTKTSTESVKTSTPSIKKPEETLEESRPESTVTTSSPRVQNPESILEGSGKAPSGEENDGIPPEKRCKGTCIAGFFAFLCDAIDRNAECPRGGRCCVTQKRPKPKPRPKPNKSETKEEEKPPRRPATTTPKPKTRKRPKTTTSAPSTTRRPKTTTKRPRTTTSTEPPPPPCPGNCLPVSVASRCQAPSQLIVASGCRDDEICCDDTRNKKPPEIKTENKPSAASQVPQALGTLLSLFGGGGSQSNKPPPRRRTRPPKPTTTTTTTTTTVPTTTTEVIEIPECPGTCISPILSFTCFGNAEITDLFRCTKEKQSCCAPKSAIRELNRQNEMSNTILKRNDTVFGPPFQHFGGNFMQPPFNNVPMSQYPHPPSFDKPNFIPPPFQNAPETGAYPHQFYHPPPTSPPHSVHNQQTPPSFEYPPHAANQPSFESPTREQTYPVYNQPPHEVPQNAPQRPPFPPTNQAPTPYHQPQPTYANNQSIRYSLPTELTTPVPLLTTPSEYGEDSEAANKYVCGVKGTKRAGRVVGGEDSIPGEWCWQVALINSLNQYLCGGALIGTQWVLTAAHCVTNIVRSGDAIYVRVGDHDLTTRYGSPGAQTIPVATTYIHHNHNSQTLDNDIALLKLSSHAELGNGVCLVCLPARGVSQVAGKRCTVTGYGYMGETGPIPLRVREAEIPVVSDNECVRKINAVTEKIFILPASSFCAGGESGHDACQGDGGGPLVCNVDNYYELSGLVSWGFGCGRQDVPGVYVKVSSFIGWVNQIISVNNL